MLYAVPNVVFLMLAMLQPEVVHADRGRDDIVVGERIELHSSILDESRTIEVYLPRNYEDSTEAYPVLVVLDGGGLFRYCVSIFDMIAPNHFPQMIIIGLPNTNRYRDLHPLDTQQAEPEAGTRRFLRFLRHELIPHIEKLYRAAPYRVLTGHSLAGLFTIYAMIEDPDLFAAYIATSPSISTTKYLAFVLDKLGKKPQGALSGKFLYVSGGGAEGATLRPAIEKLDETLEKRQAVNFQHHFEIFDGEGHVPIKGFYEAVRLNFAGWFPREAFMAADLPATKKHYEDLSSRFGFPVKPPYDILGAMAGIAERAGRTEVALAVHRAQQAAYPNEEAPRQKLAELGVKDLTGPYLGQPTPGLIPRPFADFLAPATDNKHSQLTWSSDGKELYYSVYPNGDFPQKIMVTRQRDGGWTPPQVAPFSGTYQEGGPVFSPDGKRLYYYSKRPLPGRQKENDEHDAWYVERLGEDWSKPKPLGEPINSEHGDKVSGFRPSGDMILVRYIDRKACLYRSSPVDGGWSKPELIKRVFDGEEFYQAADMGEGDYFIFTVNKKTWGPWYNAYLYISFRHENGSWTAPKNMGDMINRGEGRFPSFSPDGKYLFFTSYRTGRAGYYWVDAEVIDYLRNHDLDLVAQLANIVKVDGVAAARRRFAELRIQHEKHYQFDELLFDDVGDELTWAKLTDLAVEVLRLNQELYPDAGSLLRRIKIAALTADKTAMGVLRPGLAAGDGPDEGELNGWGRNFIRSGHHRGAILIFELNLALHPRAADAHAGLAAAYNELGEIAKAKESLEKALHIDPDNRRAIQLREQLENGG